MMGSRIRENPKNLFDCFLEIVPPKDDEGQPGQPWILHTFPHNYKEKEAERLKSVPQFAFPCSFVVDAVQHFSFVLTNLEAKWTFGFCRFAPRGDTALVILSSLPWHELFYKLLNQCADLTHSADSGDLTQFLDSVHKSRLPLPGLVFHVEYANGRVFTSPTPNFMNLPSIPENRNLTEYYNAVDPHNMLVIFASMLYERRILVTSKRLYRLSACVQAANAIIYPMSWQHIYIPVLPTQLMDYLSAPMPFLIGVPEPIMKRARRSEMGDVVILDADNNRVETPFDDLDSLPAEVVANLKKSLKSPTQALGDGVARAFLQALVHLIGGYRDALRHRQGEKITFNEDAFILSRSSGVQPFLEKMLQLQIFRQFIEERLELLNSGKGFSDEFELECVAFTEKSNKKFKTQYAAITQNVKKEGGAFVKAVRNKANPAVKDAVKSVKDGSKIAKHKAKATYRDVKSRLRDNKEEMREEGSHSAPSSPVNSRSSTLNRYGTIGNAPQFPRQNTDLTFGTAGRVLKYERFDPTSPTEEPTTAAAPKDSPDFEEFPKLEYNLMNDLEEVMNRSKAESAGGYLTRERVPPPRPPAQVAITNIIPTALPEPNNHTRKPSVGDLIKLDSDDLGEVEFDPFAPAPVAAGAPPQPPQHRKLSRSDAFSGTCPPPGIGGGPGMMSSSTQLMSNSSLYPALRPTNNHHSQGKYENYVPPGGVASQNQFREFLSTMTTTNTTDHQRQLARSSDDLLSEYGLNFGKMSVNNSGGVSAFGGGGDGFHYDNTHRSLQQTQNNNFAAAAAVVNGSSNTNGLPTYTRPSFSAHPTGSGGISGPPPQPPPRNGGLSAGGNARPPNSSFLYTSNQVYSAVVLNNGGSTVDSTVMPVNQKLQTATLPSTSSSSSTPPYSRNRDLLAELDPLRVSNGGGTGGSSLEGDLGLRPPAVPPRSKKQWTTFD